jgi:hypothetical protein
MSKKQSAFARRLAAKEAQILSNKDNTLQQELIKTNLIIANNLESTSYQLTETKNKLNYNLDDSISDSLITTVNKKDSYKTTSTSTIDMSNIGNVSFTVGTNLSYTAQQTIVVFYNTATYFFATVKSYNAITGVMQAVGTSRVGNGTYSSWTINLSSEIVTAGTGIINSNAQFSINFAANGEVSSTKAVRADDSRLSGISPNTGLFDIDGGDATVYTGTPILDGGVA